MNRRGSGGGSSRGKVACHLLLLALLCFSELLDFFVCLLARLLGVFLTLFALLLCFFVLLFLCLFFVGQFGRLGAFR